MLSGIPIKAAPLNDWTSKSCLDNCSIEMMQEIGLSLSAKWEMGYLTIDFSIEHMTLAHIGCWKGKQPYERTEPQHDYILDLTKV